MDLDTVKDAITSQLSPDSIEVSIAADVPMSDLENLCLAYLGTVPPKRKERVPMPLHSINVKPLGKSSQLGVYLPDMEERAMGYLAGPAPNIWGVFADGSTISDAIFKITGKKDDRIANPLFGHVALLVLQEVANRRLFSIVREERRLTYDASFQFRGQEAIRGGWYMVSVTSSPEQVQDAVRACKESLYSLKGSFGVIGDAVQSAKRTLSNRFQQDIATNKYWVDCMSGTQLDCIPFKSLKFISDYEKVLSGMTVQDIQYLVEIFNFDEANMTACIGIASPKNPSGSAGKK
jgi:predicted Zn-dependent peptidase